ncbi:MAG: UvrB/UvrC motif-containing protein [Devosia sp.]
MSLINNDRKIAALEKQMADAVAREDYEAAAGLRDAIMELRGEVQAKQPPPGSMGLGTNVPVVEPPKGWQRPKKPDLRTNVKSRKR